MISTPATSRAWRGVSSGCEGRRARFEVRTGRDLRAAELLRVLLAVLERMLERDRRVRLDYMVGPEMAVDPFQVAEARYRHLVEQRRGGDLDPRSFRAAVRQLGVVDGEGRQWILGPEDGGWYRRERDRWIAADPPRRLVCPECGHHNLPRHSFCVECGQQLDRF